jgi:alpha-ketoglutarate-dependent taurine dioxygenase
MTAGDVPAARPVMRRRAVSLDPADLVEIAASGDPRGGPGIARPRAAVDLAQWVKAGRDLVDRALHTHGALLLRGFGIYSAAQFERVVHAFTDDLSDYVEGTSPRTAITDKVYTSTEYPSQYPISMHNELSYAHRWPGRLFFCCAKAADSGGETPIADGRRLLAALDPALVSRFSERGLRYLRLMHDGRGPGLSWQTVFETEDRAAVEEYCREGGIEYSWLGDGWLRTAQERPAVVRHPRTGERVWFNQADQWHPSNLGGGLERAITSAAGPADLPLNVTYGDGGTIDPADFAAVREAARGASVALPWSAGDVMVVDNTMALHGRLPFSGPRRVLVAMGDPVRLDQVEH